MLCEKRVRGGCKRRVFMRCVVRCRAAVTAESPLDELEVALDAMCSMKEPFYGRYTLLSSVERRVGGQGLVQFASIVNTQDKVRSLGCQSTVQCGLHHFQGEYFVQGSYELCTISRHR